MNPGAHGVRPLSGYVHGVEALVPLPAVRRARERTVAALEGVVEAGPRIASRRVELVAEADRRGTALAHRPLLLSVAVGATLSTVTVVVYSVYPLSLSMIRARAV
jgi:hypothetical protein